MAGSRLPIAIAHGEGRAEHARADDAARAPTVLRHIHGDGSPADTYPANPNGSPDGLAGYTSVDGRATILMPHPERVFRMVQWSWRPDESVSSSPRVTGRDGESPWMRLFRNARVQLG
jgi:phosphoribosylformylglycinamidine synthase